MSQDWGWQASREVIHSAGREQPQAERGTQRASRRCQLDCVVDVVVHNANQRSQTTPRPRGYGQKAPRVLSDESRDTKEWVVALSLCH
jgi:hypothetical protein